MKYLHKENISHKFIQSYQAPNYINLLISEDEYYCNRDIVQNTCLYIPIKELYMQ